MSTNQHPVVLPAEALEGSDGEVVDANIDVVNAMYSELLGEEEIATNALRSYYVDFYLTEALDGGFAQYVVSAGEREEIDDLVLAGLREMGAVKHLGLFEETSAAFDALTDEEAEAYLEGDGEPSAAVAALETLDERFEETLDEEDLVALNAAWLRGQEGLLALDDDAIEQEIARRVGLIPDLEERRAEAELLDDGFGDAYDDEEDPSFVELDDDADQAPTDEAQAHEAPVHEGLVREASAEAQAHEPRAEKAEGVAK